MLFEIAKESLLDGLSKAVPITEKKSALPILSHVLLDATGSELVLIATDLSVGLRMQYQCEIKEAGILAVPCRKLFEMVKELGAGAVHLSLTETGRLKIMSGKSVFELAGMDASDYPAWLSYEEVETAPLQAEKLVFMLDKTLFACSSDESRFNLNGVLFEQNEDRIKLVATDGHRLATIDEDLGMVIPSRRVVVAKKNLIEMKRMLEGFREEVRLGFESKNMIVRTDRFMMTVRLTEGDYPDYRKVIPKPGDRIVRADHGQVTQTLRRAAVLTSERSKGITIDVRPGAMEITAVHPDLGIAQDVIDAHYEGESFSVIVNVNYLMDSLASVNTETVFFDFHEEGGPIVVHPEPAANYFNLVMPMRK